MADDVMSMLRELSASVTALRAAVAAIPAQPGTPVPPAVPATLEGRLDHLQRDMDNVKIKLGVN